MTYSISLNTLIRIYIVLKNESLIAKVQVTNSKITMIFTNKLTKELENEIRTWATSNGISAPQLLKPITVDLKKTFMHHDKT